MSRLTDLVYQMRIEVSLGHSFLNPSFKQKYGSEEKTLVIMLLTCSAIYHYRRRLISCFLRRR